MLETTQSNLAAGGQGINLTRKSKYTPPGERIKNWAVE
jgi:hypothetical protein